MYSKKLNAQRIENAFKKKTKVSEDERGILAERFFGNFDEMRVNPTQDGFVEIVNNVNMLTNFIYATALRKNRRKLGDVPNIHMWLCERFKLVAQTINQTHECLIDVEKRCTSRGSWALDSTAITLIEKTLIMLVSALYVCPLNLIVWATNQAVNAHKKKADGYHIRHLILHDDYIIKEEIWNEGAIENDE